jgi:hypothetical protein
MKLLFGLLGLFLLSTSIVREEKVSFEIKGNPKCLVRKERYELKADLKSSDKDEFIFLEASGVSLTKNNAGWSMFVSPSKEAKTIKIAVSIKNDRTKKSKVYRSYTFDLCE